MGQDGANRYSYVYNHPTAFIDPSGFDGGESGGEDESESVSSPVIGNDSGVAIDSVGAGQPSDLGMVDQSSDTSSPMTDEENSTYLGGEEHAGPSSGGVGADAYYGDGFSSDSSLGTAKFDLAAVRYAQDPASSDGEKSSPSMGMGWLGLMLMAVLNPPAAIVAGAGVAIAEGAVVVEQNMPQIKEVVTEVATAEAPVLNAVASAFGQMMSRLGSFMSEEISAAGRVFWSGPGTSEAANTWAQANGGNTLDTAENMSLAESRQLIDVASRIFAEGANGEVHVFHGTYVDMGSTWAKVEYPALMDNSNVTNIIYHQIQIPLPGQ